MTVSKYGKSYHTADGAEQQDDPQTVAPLRPREMRQAMGNWADDGGASNDAVPAPIAAAAPVKPGWSLQPLRDLLAAVRTAELGALTQREHDHALASAAAGRARAQYEQELLAAERNVYPWFAGVTRAPTPNGRMI